MMEKMEAFDPSFTVKKCAETFERITCDSDILPQVSLCFNYFPPTPQACASYFFFPEPLIHCMREFV